MLKSVYALVVGTSASLLMLAAACGDSKDDSDKDSDEAALTGDCASISEACHQADEGSGEPHVCHELAHTNVAADCTAQKDACEAVCAAALDAGTSADAATEADAAAHTH